MPKVYFTSDSHYGHKNMVKDLSNWTDKKQCRDFPSVEAMNDSLVEGINSVVKPDDTLYHLGDFNFGGIRNLGEFRRRLVCENIHLLLGNHDFNHGQLDHHTVAHGFSSVGPYKEIIVKGQEIVLSHYAHRVWNRQADGSWMLYGHSHGTLPREKNFSMDVGVDREDGIFNPVPWSFEEIRERFLIAGDKVGQEDHHYGNARPAPPLQP